MLLKYTVLDSLHQDWLDSGRPPSEQERAERMKEVLPAAPTRITDNVKVTFGEDGVHVDDFSTLLHQNRHITVGNHIIRDYVGFSRVAFECAARLALETGIIDVSASALFSRSADDARKHAQMGFDRTRAQIVLALAG